jgi:hypothetical protein
MPGQPALFDSHAVIKILTQNFHFHEVEGLTRLTW